MSADIDPFDIDAAVLRGVTISSAAIPAKEWMSEVRAAVARLSDAAGDATTREIAQLRDAHAVEDELEQLKLSLGHDPKTALPPPE